MLATVAALQLLVLSQATPPPPPVPPDAPVPEERPAGSATPPAEPGQRGAEPVPSPVPARPKPRQVSILSAESLQGGSAALGWVGWPEIGGIYAIGLNPRDDAGVYLTYDWAKSETRIGALWRRPLSKAGAFDMGLRLSLAYYSNFGADYFYDQNRSDRGFELVPGLSLSTHGGGGILSILGEAPMTITGKYETGFLFSPRASVAFEAPLYPAVTVGARVGVGYRAGAGGAPLKEGRGEFQFLLLAGYQLL